jgi:serine/threonine protein kinase
MPSPSSSAEFLELVQKSGLVEDKRLNAYSERLRADNTLPPEAKILAQQMIQDGILTHFQAEQILQGKWRRFNIGKYKVLERLGAGGMGSVYLCEHKLMRRRVAVKVLPTAKATDPSSLERFYREARAVAALDHPNIVRAYDIDEDDKLHFLVMEHVDGSNLQDIIKKSGPLSVERATNYIRQAALGLQHAHDAAGIVHRDVKPGNVLVDRNGIVKLLDMGLARFFHDEDDMLTKKYDENVLGTADYLAPEQATDSHGVDIRADIYSLGATLYFCLTGRTPFAEGTVAQKLIWHQTRLPKPVKSFRPDVPDELIAVLDKAMAKDVSQRYQLPVEFAEALNPWTQSAIPPPPPEEMPNLSPAAMGNSINDTGTIITRGGSDTGAEPPSSRKVWQVPAPPTPRSTPKPAPAAGPPQKETPAKPAPPGSVKVPLAKQGSVKVPLATPASAKVPVASVPPPTIVAKKPPGAVPRVQVNGRPRPVAAPPKPSTHVPADNHDAAIADTSPEGSLPTPGVEVKKKPPPKKPTPTLVATLADKPLSFWAIAAGGLLAATLVIAGLIWAAAHLLAAPATTSMVGGTNSPFYVGGPNDPPLNDVLAKARDNCRIVLQGDIEASGVSVKWPSLTIESAPGHTFTWKCPPSADPKAPLLDVDGVEGLIVRNIKFDGGNQTETLIQLRGKCPNVTLQNLELHHFKTAGVTVSSCTGTADRRVIFSHLEATLHSADQAAILFTLTAGDPIQKNRWFRIEDCIANNKPAAVKISPRGAAENIEPASVLKIGG